MKKLFFLISLSLFLIQKVEAQFNFEQLIKAGPADVEKLVDAYSRPLLYGFGLGMNSGWANSAQTIKPLHFDLRIMATGSLIPTSKQTFDVTAIGLSSNLRPSDPNKIYSPTFTGNRYTNGPYMDLFDGNGNKLISFELPSAVIENIVPTPQVQLTVGFAANTEVMIRAAPRIKLGERFGSISLFGLGIKHNFVRDFVAKEVKKTPFDFSLLIGFNRLNYNRALNLQPLDGMIPENAEQATDFSGQKIYGKFDNYLLQATISKEINFFTPFLSLGYSISSATLGLKGNFPIPNSIRNDQVAYITYQDPFELRRTYLKTFRGDVGFQLKFPVVRLYGSYGFSGGYGMLSAGIGLGF